MNSLPVSRFFEEEREELKLEQLTDSLDSPVEITTSDVNRPGMALMGFLENFLAERIQILGKTEISYLEQLSDAECRAAVERLVQFQVPCLIVAKALEVNTGLVARCNELHIPVMRTPMSTTPFIHDLTKYLDTVFAPSIIMHASLVDVYGVGLLFTGKSGIGKSETALDLVERGHRLVADDVVTLTRRQGDVLIGTGNQVLAHRMEIRGLGIIDVQSIFGIRSIRHQKRIEVQVNLHEWGSLDNIERLGLEDRQTTILDVNLPYIDIPIFPGKNITVIAEVVALNYLVKVYGYNPAEFFNQHLLETMHRRQVGRSWVRDDTE
ncbi:MAG TPA: HPr(Ser) kinase/phosphatase [Candidatus Saccharimonadales bacterium]|nr:HPr(Ser) kinase/phosphatase [Candidatus Saccharimonadales bacterium]